MRSEREGISVDDPDDVADEIVERLIELELVDDEGTPLFDTEPGGPVYRGARKAGRSPWSNDDLTMYELHVTAWDDPDHEVAAEHFPPGFDDWDRLMFIVGGEGWSVAGLSGPPDAVVDLDLADQVAEALEGEIVFSGVVPEGRWFTARFANTNQLERELRRLGIVVERLTGDDLESILGHNEHLNACYSDREYLPLRFSRDVGSRSTAVLHLLLDNHYADQAAGFAASYLELEPDANWAICSGNGWAAALVDLDGASDFPLALWAAELSGALAGSHVELPRSASRAHQNPAVIDAFSALGSIARMPADTVARLTQAYDDNTFTDPHDLIRMCFHVDPDLSFLARESCRYWHERWLAIRHLERDDPKTRERELEVIGAARLTCWAALALAIVASLPADESIEHPLTPDQREKLLADVRQWEAIAGPMTTVRALRSPDTVASHPFDYAELRFSAEVDALANHGHVIPITTGVTAEYLTEYFPGWTWNALTGLLKTAGALTREPAPAPLVRDPAVAAVFFTDLDSWAVERIDGSVTRSTAP